MWCREAASLNKMVGVFRRNKSIVSRYIRNVFEEGKLIKERQPAQSVQQWLGIVNTGECEYNLEGKTRASFGMLLL